MTTVTELACLNYGVQSTTVARDIRPIASWRFARVNGAKHIGVHRSSIAAAVTACLQDLGALLGMVQFSFWS